MQDGTGTKYDPNQSAWFNENTSLYAQWDPIEYAIQYDMNEIGAVPTDALFKYTIEDRYVPPNPIEVQGYSFVGWTPSGIIPGMTGDITFTANWEESQKLTISYNKCVNAATLPSGLKTTYTEDEIETADYTPDPIDNIKTIIVKDGAFSSSDYLQQEVCTFTFIRWSPDKLYSGHVGDMAFDGDWSMRYTSYLCYASSSYAASYRLGNRYIFVKIPLGEYKLSFGTDQSIFMNHDGDKTTHGIRLYLSVFMYKSGSSLAQLTNIPIPPECVYVQDSNGKYTKKVSSLTSSFWGDADLTTMAWDGHGTTTQTLKKKTVYYGFHNGNSQTSSFQIRDVPVVIPTPNSSIPSSMLRNGGTGFRYPTLSGYTQLRIKLVADPDDCENMSTWISRKNARVYALLTPINNLPINTTATYTDGTSADTNVGPTLSATHLTSTPLYNENKTYKRIHVGNLVKRIETSANQGWGETEEVIIHGQVATIDANAFEGSKLINMVIPSTVTSVGNYAFKNCAQLASLVLNAPLTAVDGKTGLLEGCVNLKTLRLNYTQAQYNATKDAWWGETTPPEDLVVVCTD